MERTNVAVAVLNSAAKETAKVPTELLDFDPNNPRLVEDGIKNPSDTQIILALADTADLAEVVASVAANGYIDIEPIIAQQINGRWRVLEGNRRLAAIRLLKDPALAKGTGISIPTISVEKAKTLDAVTVYPVDSPEQAREFIGFKHINGPQKWDALAKARFAADWYKKDRASGLTIEKIAKRLGDGHDTVVRLVNGMLVLDQAKSQKLYDIADRYPGKRFAFSHLYTALTRPGYREFLGLPEEWRSHEPKTNPVPKDKGENLKQVLLWLYGSKPDGVRPVITSQNPDLKYLAEVLASPVARRTMLATGDLRAAHAHVERKGARFENALISAKQQVEVALGQIIGYDPQDSTLLEIGRDLRDSSERLFENMVAAGKKAPAKAEPKKK
jgi:ParB-like chromosome segregation protein Spo0J